MKPAIAERDLRPKLSAKSISLSSYEGGTPSGRLGDREAEILARNVLAAPNVPAVKHVDLTHNRIGPAGGLAFFTALRDNPAIRQLETIRMGSNCAGVKESDEEDEEEEEEDRGTSDDGRRNRPGYIPERRRPLGDRAC